jgi:orotidine-5'-phosphate decarboxylase
MSLRKPSYKIVENTQIDTNRVIVDWKFFDIPNPRKMVGVQFSRLTLKLLPQKGF